MKSNLNRFILISIFHFPLAFFSQNNPPAPPVGPIGPPICEIAKPPLDSLELDSYLFLFQQLVESKIDTLNSSSYRYIRNNYGVLIRVRDYKVEWKNPSQKVTRGNPYWVKTTYKDRPNYRFIQTRFNYVLKIVVNLGLTSTIRYVHGIIYFNVYCQNWGSPHGKTRVSYSTETWKIENEDGLLIKATDAVLFGLISRGIANKLNSKFSALPEPLILIQDPVDV